VEGDTVKNPSDINQSQRLFIELGTSLLLEPMLLESIDLDPTDLDPIDLEPMHLGRSVTGQLIGMRVGKYLIVHLSDNNWTKSLLKGGDHLQVKYVCSDDVFGFDTQVMTIVEEPDRLLFLDYPDEVESCNIRSRKRVECYICVEMVLEDGTARKGVVLNINDNGCLCMVDGLRFEDVSRNSQVSLRFPYAQFDTLFTMAVVKSIGSDNGKLKIGLMFEGLDPYSRTILSTLVPGLKA
jgi:hypothetical protein